VERENMERVERVAAEGAFGGLTGTEPFAQDLVLTTRVPERRMIAQGLDARAIDDSPAV
jgi:hypothetical protein